MLIGIEDVKADTWVMRFIQDVLPKVTDAERARQLVTSVAGSLGVEPRFLDHAIWEYQRAK